MSEQEERRVPRLAGPLQTITLLDMADLLMDLRELMQQHIPEGIVEPLHPVNVAVAPITVQPPIKGKYWFGITIVKEDPVELNIIINSGKSSTTPYTMSEDENVYDQYFNIPCIYDVTLWTNEGTCVVKVRGSR